MNMTGVESSDRARPTAANTDPRPPRRTSSPTCATTEDAPLAPGAGAGRRPGRAGTTAAWSPRVRGVEIPRFQIRNR